ncbi:cytochrome P450 [Coprinopsis cinerea AmutBmut pab1-1]|nr:cytochrome P450 [Coprinopsis cinerea AmutBmut pab1-1]
MKYGHYITMMPYGSRWKQHRKVFHQHLVDGKALSNCRHLMIKHTKAYLKLLLIQPGDWKAHTKQLFSGLIVEVTYGIKAGSAVAKELVRYTDEVAEGFGEACLPGRFMVDNLPVLKYVPSWFPGAGFKRFAEYYANVVQKSRDRPFDYVLQKRKESGEAPPTCVVTNMMENGEDEEVARNVASVTHAAGSDTTLGVALAFLNLIAMYPEVQSKAQSELDEVVGPGRMPDFSDRDRLVYIKAILNEALRMHQTNPMGVPHATTSDDIYDGYFIPKGTVVLGNAWYILHDPKVYDDPMVFRPERFLKDGKFNDAVLDPSEAVFGYGRRVCPGRNFTMDALFLMISSTLAFFNVDSPKDGAGNPTIRYVPQDSGVSHPEPFQITLSPRSKEHEDFVACI